MTRGVMPSTKQKNSSFSIITCCVNVIKVYLSSIWDNCFWCLVKHICLVEHIFPSRNPPPCRQARLGVFGPSSGGLMSGICVFLRDPQPVTCVTRLVFFEHFFGSYFLMTFWSPMIPQSVQVGLHVGSFLESCCLTFPIFSGVYLGS